MTEGNGGDYLCSGTNPGDISTTLYQIIAVTFLGRSALPYVPRSLNTRHLHCVKRVVIQCYTHINYCYSQHITNTR